MTPAGGCRPWPRAHDVMCAQSSFTHQGTACSACGRVVMPSNFRMDQKVPTPHRRSTSAGAAACVAAASRARYAARVASTSSCGPGRCGGVFSAARSRARRARHADRGSCSAYHRLRSFSIIHASWPVKCAGGAAGAGIELQNEDLRMRRTSKFASEAPQVQSLPPAAAMAARRTQYRRACRGRKQQEATDSV